MDALRVTEIFLSVQGEARTVGWPTVFVRLTGCPLRCQYCDTAYAFSGGTILSIADVVSEVRSHRVRHVTVTGGEPLAQPGALPLLALLCDEGYDVALETSGALDISEVDSRVSRVVDIKTPGSGEVSRNRLANLDLLSRNDQVKFVICNANDYAWAKLRLDEYRIADRVDDVFFSPSSSELPAATLADWMLEDRLDVRLQVQMHKVLWGDVPGR